MNTQTRQQNKPDPGAGRPGTVCFPARLMKLPGIPREKLAYTPLPPENRGIRQLLEEFRAAPQFAQIDPRRLLEQRRGGLGVILLTQSDYYARQAAMYLTAIVVSAQSKLRGREDALPDELFWLEEDGEENPLENALAVASPALLDPHLEEGREKGAHPDGASKTGFPSAAALLVAAPAGPVLSRQVVENLPLPADPDGEERGPFCVFVALHPQQVDLELVEELRFSYGYHVCRVGQPDQGYLRRVLLEFLEPVGETAPDFDADQVIAALRQYRGAAFDETDLERAALWAVQRGLSGPLTARDLIFRPLSLERQGRERLDAMVGLTPVKETVERLTARLLLERQRSMEGRPMSPACRNMAFSGPPGTGKSVVARLVAQILREEGVGTGRFVEAGREQLIGSYLGQTSPKVAALFEKARGGVLFIDEAGALLNARGDDIYAAEAVNALVRHMELHPETVVIFATYPQEMEQLLASNPGLSSRVARVLDFPGYSDAELLGILEFLARAEGDRIPPEAGETCLEFFRQLRQQKGDCFGNGREARRLYQAAVEELALRRRKSGGADELCSQDLARAAARLLEQPAQRRQMAAIGF